jgi:hypothetical protein
MERMYRVAFHFYTDCRVDWTGHASSELAALVLAQDKLGSDVADWCGVGKGFKIIIERV